MVVLLQSLAHSLDISACPMSHKCHRLVFITGFSSSSHAEHRWVSNWEFISVRRAMVARRSLRETFSFHIYAHHLTNGHKMNWIKRKKIMKKKQMKWEKWIEKRRRYKWIWHLKPSHSMPQNYPMSLFFVWIFLCLRISYASIEWRLCQIRASKRNTIVCDIFQLPAKALLIAATHWNPVEVVPTIVWPVRIQGKSLKMLIAFRWIETTDWNFSIQVRSIWPQQIPVIRHEHQPRAVWHRVAKAARPIRAMGHTGKQWPEIE